MKLIDWIESLQANGKYTFHQIDVKQHFPQIAKKALEMSLYRLTSNGYIQSIYKGFYVIIPIQHRNFGGLPTTMFIDDLMKYLGRAYYVSHLTAAALHGSAHQQPQEFYVTHNSQSLRKIKKGIMPINFIKRKAWDDKAVIVKKSEAGYFNVSNPLLTALDLIDDQNKIGGINRVATVLDDLAEQIESYQELILQQKMVNVQRLGFVLDSLGYKKLTDQIYEIKFKGEKPKNRYLLKAGASGKGYSSKNRWNIIENTKIEIDQ
jgi:predicted transcriptional regulator of viral defense system